MFTPSQPLALPFLLIFPITKIAYVRQIISIKKKLVFWFSFTKWKHVSAVE